LLADHKNSPENKFSDHGTTRKKETKREELNEGIKAHEAKANTIRNVTFAATQDTNKTTNDNSKDEKNKKIYKEDDENKETEESRKEATKTNEEPGGKTTKPKADSKKSNNNYIKEEDSTGSTDLEWPIKKEPRPCVFKYWHCITRETTRYHKFGFTTGEIEGTATQEAA
jgi:hypothetical protein